MHDAAHASSFADAAPEFHRAGLNVIPVVPGEKTPPRGFRWGRWQEDRQTDRDLDQLCRRFPKHGVGIVLGGPGLSLVDVETDSPAGEEALRRSGLPVPDTAAFTSPHGGHYLFRGPGRLPRRVKALPDVDVLGSGYAIVPPSTGRVWLHGLEALADLPAEWEDFLAQRVSPRDTPTRETPRKQVTREEEARRGWLAGLYRDAASVRAVAAVLGIPGEFGRGFRCILPGHPETNPSASLGLDSTGIPVYYDWHERDALKVLTLPEVRAALAYGEVRRFRGPELATWGLRLLVEAGVLHAVHVDGPTLPAWEPSHVHQVYSGFLFLLGCKWLYEHGAPTAFSWRFAAAWCGVPQKLAGEAIQHLCYEGYMHVVDRAGLVTLFLSGPGHARSSHARKE